MKAAAALLTVLVIILIGAYIPAMYCNSENFTGCKAEERPKSVAIECGSIFLEFDGELVARAGCNSGYCYLETKDKDRISGTNCTLFKTYTDKEEE